jgi:hypothetical protein
LAEEVDKPDKLDRVCTDFERTEVMPMEWTDDRRDVQIELEPRIVRRARCHSWERSRAEVRPRRQTNRKSWTNWMNRMECTLTLGGQKLPGWTGWKTEGWTG